MTTPRFLSAALKALLGHASAPANLHRVFPSHIHVSPKLVYTVCTSVYTFLVAFIGLMILSPLLVVIAVAVKLSSPGPALYRGQRVGLNKATFNILKFRTMKVGSEAKIGKRLVRQDEDHYTSIGRFLRKYRLDELPQLINVLKRDMNLVGPRPVRPIFLNDHSSKIPGYERRFLVRPGITGQAQVRGGYYTSPRHKLFYDLLYISRRTIVFDVQLIVLTFARVMTRIFTTTLLFGWLISMVLVAPPEVNAVMTFTVSGLTVNFMYLVPTLITIIHFLRRRREQRRVVALRTPADVPILLFMLWSLVIIPFSPDLVGALRGSGWWACNGVIVFYLVLNSRMVTDGRTSLTGVLVFGATIVGLTDLIPQIFEWIDTRQFSRLQSHKFSPILLSSVIALSFPWALSRCLTTPVGITRRLYTMAAILLALTAVLTLSRSGMLATTCTGLFVVWPFKRRWALAGGVFVVAIFATLGLSGDQRINPERTLEDFQNTTARQIKVLSHIQNDPSVKKHHLATGLGARVLGRFAVGERYQNHRPRLVFSNMYLTIFVDQGIIGLLFFCLFLLRTYGYLAVHLGRLKDESANHDLRAALAGIGACIFLFFFSDALYELPMMITFFSALGLAVGLAAHYGPHGKKVFRIIQYRHQL